MSQLPALRCFIFTFIIACIHGENSQEDFHITLTHSAINDLVQYTIPLIIEHVESQAMPSATTESVLDVTVSNIHVRSFRFNWTFSFNSSSQQIHTQISNLSLVFWPFQVSVSKQISPELGLTCNALFVPSFTAWDFEFALNPSVSPQCTLALDVDDSSININPGTVAIGTEFGSKLCSSMVTVTDYIIDFKQSIQTLILNKMPEIISNDLQLALNGALSSMGYIPEAEMALCFTVFGVTDLRLAIGGYFITDLEDLDTANITLKLDTQSEIAAFSSFNEEMNVAEDMSGSKNLIVILFVVSVFVMIGIGFGVTYGILCCVYKCTVKDVESDQSERKPNEHEKEPMIKNTSTAI